jgi:hypothetical protein
VCCKQIRTLAVNEELLDVLDVALHSCFHVLLGVADVALVHLETCCFVHHDRVVTLASVWAHILVPAVAREFLEVCSCKGVPESHLR